MPRRTSRTSRTSRTRQRPFLAARLFCPDRVVPPSAFLPGFRMDAGFCDGSKRGSVLEVHDQAGDRARPGSCRKTGKKNSKSVCETLLESKKISGTVLLSHSQLYSTIAAGVLNHRVREGNGCFNSAMSPGKNYNEEKCLSGDSARLRLWRKRVVGNSLDFFLKFV